MAFKQYKGDRMPSALPQKNLSEPEGDKKNFNENKLETLNEIQTGRYNRYNKKVGELVEDRNLTPNQKKDLNKKMYNQMIAANTASRDSINRVTRADLASINPGGKYHGDLTAAQIDKMEEDGFLTNINAPKKK